jgi:hypothetical protein
LVPWQRISNEGIEVDDGDEDPKDIDPTVTKVIRRGNPRCSMAIFWRAKIGTHDEMPLSGWHDGNFKHRPVFWIAPPKSPKIGCIHSPGSIKYILAAIDAIRLGGQPWLLAGDYNFNPAKLSDYLPPEINIQATNGSTQKSGGNLDYALSQAVQLFKDIASANSYVKSDHLQVRMA